MLKNHWDKVLLVCIIICLVFWHTPAQGAEISLSLQQDIKSEGAEQLYTGAVDRKLDRYDTQNGTLTVGFNRSSTSLLSFNLSQIPSTSTISKAYLNLYISGTETEGYVVGNTRLYELHRIMLSWDAEAPWNERNIGERWSDKETSVPVPGTDYENEISASCSAAESGTWVTFDVTALVQAWVHDPNSNYGVILLDSHGYNDPPGSGNYRSFASCEATDLTQRPKLEIQYDDSTPMANAGEDIVNLQWDGSPVQLDASKSMDRLGGDDGRLTYSWQAVQAPYGSSLLNQEVASAVNPSFSPDMPGEWELELTVQNAEQKVSTDRIHLRLLKIATRDPQNPKPRIFFTDEIRSGLLGKINNNDPTFTRFRAYMDANINKTREDLAYATDPASQYALLYQLLKDSNVPEDREDAVKYADKAINLLMAIVNSDTSDSYTSYMRSALTGAEMSMAYDWLYGYAGFTDEIRTSVREHIKPRMEWGMDDGNNKFAFQNENLRAMRALGMAGMAFYGEPGMEDAGKWIDCARNERFATLFLPGLDLVGTGGGWGEGEQYSNSLELPMEFMLAWRTATGEDLFYSSLYFKDLIDHYIHANSMDWACDYGSSSWAYHQLTRRGEMDTRYATFHDRTRYALQLIVTGLEPQQDTDTQQLIQRAWDWMVQPPPTPGDPDTSARVVDCMNNDTYCFRDFLWDISGKGNVDTKQYGPLAHIETGIGMVYSRSSWEPDATWVTFQAGDHYNSHQQKDQGHFTVYKGGYLAIDSGSYDWFRSPHTANYANQSIAHNTIAVLDPSEPYGFGYNQVAADTYPEVNTEGQRAWDASPFRGEVPSVEDFNRYKEVYDNGDITRYEDRPEWTYASADLSKAYSNKIQEFDREFLFLRPKWVLVYDRVRIREASLTPRWILHMTNEPVIEGNTLTAINGHHLRDQVPLSGLPDGKLFNRTLLPADPVIEKIGGPGKEYWVGGKNFPPDGNDRINEGSWRVEVSQKTAGTEQQFLNVMYATDVNTAAMPAVNEISANGMQGASIEDAASPWVVLFNQSGTDLVSTIGYSFAPLGKTSHLLMGLTPGTQYSLATAMNAAQQQITLTPGGGGFIVSDQGTLNFSTEAEGIALNHAPEVTLVTADAAQRLSPEGEVSIHGFISDSDGEAVTLSATLGGVTKSITIPATPVKTPETENFSLTWSGSLDLLTNGSYSRTLVSALDQRGSSVQVIYSGNIQIDIDRSHQVFAFDQPAKAEWNWAQAAYTADEGSGTATIVVRRVPSAAAYNDTVSQGTVSVQYRTSDINDYEQQNHAVIGARASLDYTPVAGTLVFRAGETQKTISIPLLDNHQTDGRRVFVLYLASPQGGAKLLDERIRPAAVAIMDLTATNVLGVQLDKHELSIGIGKEEVLVACVNPQNATNPSVSWQSSDDTVVSVDGSGLLRARSNGTATITVKSRDSGELDQCVVTVNESGVHQDECFIATAAFGSKFTWPVVLLRHFRDQYLLTNAWGTAFVGCYYQNSPPIAAMIAASQPLKILVRVLLAPVIALVYLMYHPPLLVTGLVMLIIFFTNRSRLRRSCV